MKFPTLNENDLPHVLYFGSKVSIRIIWKMLKIVKNQWDRYISSLSFSNEVLFCCKFVGIQKMQKSFFFFFFFTYETDNSQGACHHWDQCQVIWEQFLAVTYLKMAPLSGYLSDCSGYNLASVEGPEIMEQLPAHLETILLRLQQSSLPLSLTFKQITFQQR